MVFLTLTPNATYKKVTSLENFSHHTFQSSDQENFYNSTLTGVVLGWAALESEIMFCWQHFNLITFTVIYTRCTLTHPEYKTILHPASCK